MMSMTDLVAEYGAALRQTTFQDLRPLIEAGVGGRALALAGPAVDRVVVEKGLYRPAPDGRTAFILPVRLVDPLTPEAVDADVAVAEGAIVDLIAMHPRHPSRWALRVGSATWLGAIEPQYMKPDPVAVRRSPLSWLQADCEGLVVLSAEPGDAYRLLCSLREIEAEDAGHAAELRRLVRQPWPLPSIKAAVLLDEVADAA